MFWARIFYDNYDNIWLKWSIIWVIIFISNLYMESILAILCIVFFAVLTYGLVQSSNITKYHLDDCRTIYIPEEIDLETAYKSIKGKNLNALKKRAREFRSRAPAFKV